MVALNSRKVESSLLKKGFVQEPGDHKFFYLYVDGKRTGIRTKTSHCGQEINDYLIRQMSRQVQLDKSDFLDLVNCPLSKEKYVQILKEKKSILL